MSLERNNKSKNPLVSVSENDTSCHIYITAVSHRIVPDRDGGKLLIPTGSDHNVGMGYVAARHKVVDVGGHLQLMRKMSPIKAKVLRMMRGRCVVGRR